MRLIDADELRRRMYTEVFEKDTDMQKWDSGCWIRYKLFENVLEELLSVQPEQQRMMLNDLISRQTAIDALCDGALINYQAAGHNNGLVKAIDVIRGLPPAQPEPEELEEGDQS